MNLEAARASELADAPNVNERPWRRGRKEITNQIDEVKFVRCSQNINNKPVQSLKDDPFA
jgi:hypothetical protein